MEDVPQHSHQTKDRSLNSARLISFSPISIQGPTNQICLIQCDMSQTSHDIGKAHSLGLLICVRNTKPNLIPHCVESALCACDINRIIQRRERHDRMIIWRCRRHVLANSAITQEAGSIVSAARRHDPCRLGGTIARRSINPRRLIPYRVQSVTRALPPARPLAARDQARVHSGSGTPPAFDPAGIRGPPAAAGSQRFPGSDPDTRRDA